MGDASDIKEYDRRRSGLPNAPLHIKQDTTSREKNPKHKPKPKHTHTCTTTDPYFSHHEPGVQPPVH